MSKLGEEAIDRLQALYERTEELMQEYAALQYSVDCGRGAKDLAEGELTDIGFLEREMERLLDHHRKEAKSRQLGIGKELCLIIMERFGSGSGGELKSRGKLANATPDVKQEPIVPRKGDADYDEIMASLGFPPELARAGAVSIHYNHMAEHLTALAAEGKNAPGRLSKRAVPQVMYRSNTKKSKQ
tara:strand:- start:15857 stop:16414 length:558 start_codon:yes stop_codon:yes gene_type:complete